MNIAQTASSSAPSETLDALVIGAGFGGLGAALTLAEAGARVVLCERLTYPGGCASTFSHQGYQFEAGATLIAGLGDDQLFGRWITRHNLPVTSHPMDPVVTIRTPEAALAIPPDRERWLQALAAYTGASVERLQHFLRLQQQVADALWPVLDHPEWLPPFAARHWLTHASRLPKYLRVARWIGRPLTAVLAHCGLADMADPGHRKLRRLLDALCQITIQCSAEHAEAPFALSTLDYFFRGARHLTGGVGTLAKGLAQAVVQCGGDVRYADRVKALRWVDDHWLVTTRRGTMRCRHVVANLLPSQVISMVDGLPSRALSRFESMARAVDSGWGACMLYRVIPMPNEAPAAHLELIQDPERPMTEGNHLFCSLSGPDEIDRAPEGHRTLTVSTHVPMDRLPLMGDQAAAAYIDSVHTQMRRGLDHLAPPSWSRYTFETTASPRTFARFTGRRQGFVGGVPRLVGLGNYRGLWSRRSPRGLNLVGDSTFPGQSAVATAAGGVATALRIISGLQHR